ncbi:MAG: gamma-glutamyltransferase [Methylocystis sp.]|nr:gamma-glutamyltransferase [Methylocystis sp.]
MRLLLSCVLWLYAFDAAAETAVTAQHGMVVTEHRLASDVGVAILKAGGNAVDAAVAVGYALAVVHPCCGNLGGGGFFLLHQAGGGERFINFRETAPAAAHAKMFLDAKGEILENASRIGYRAVGVPGTVLGLETAHKKYGRLSRADVIAPAIRLAAEGFVLDEADVRPLKAASKLMDSPAAARIFLRENGAPLQSGDRLIQRDLARLLAEIARDGPSAFYEGRIPRAVEQAAKAENGAITAEDFARYHVEESEPVHCVYRGYDIYSAAPPSSGGVALCEILNILEGYDLKSLGFHTPQALHIIIEAERHAFMDRNSYLGDPAFVRNPIARLTSKAYAAEIRKKILPDRATPSIEVEPGNPPHETLETTHYSILDGEGAAVSVTYTINGYFGAQVMAPDTGFVLNNEMDDFSSRPGSPNAWGLVQGDANAIAPGKRPLSSMTPTIVTKDGRVVLVLGSPNGPRIISVTLQTALNVIDYGLPLQDAVEAPRIHHQWLPDVVLAEPGALSPQAQRQLEALGHIFKELKSFGASEAIGVSGDGVIAGAHDPRSPAGAARGY